jgi:hypothetical protein
MLRYILSLKKGLLKSFRRSLEMDHKLVLCFGCSLGTGSGLALSATCFVWDSACLDLSRFGLAMSVVFFALFLFVAWRME